ncbi:hypothetical protein [Ammoniphilus oxalaticus]|uniref:hypothetical protein n=1 Tax=Ammoniphilus oxalaticus TaxID=66863 RepID=UPI0014735F60|nr:hypothetical protein [Ammoniphilus oxalaticus]
MWTCPYCGNSGGVGFVDPNLKGMLCMHPNCGRFDEMTEGRIELLMRSDLYEQSLV